MPYTSILFVGVRSSFAPVPWEHLVIPNFYRSGKWHVHVTRIFHNSDAIMNAMAYQITGVSIVYSNVCWGTYQIKHQSSVPRWPVDSHHKGPITRKTFLFDDVIMWREIFTWHVNAVTPTDGLSSLTAKFPTKMLCIHGITSWYFW